MFNSPNFFQNNIAHNHPANIGVMSVCFSYLWRCWRRKSALLGFCLLLIVFVVGMQYSTSSKQEEHLYVNKITKKSGPTRINRQPNNYFNGAKKLQYNLPSLVEEPPPNSNSNHLQQHQQKGVHFLPRQNHNKANININEVYHKLMHNQYPGKSQGYASRNQIKNNQLKYKSSMEAESNYAPYAPAGSKQLRPKSSFEEVNHPPQPGNFDNGEYDNSNNQQLQWQPGNAYRGDQGGYIGGEATPDPDAPPYIPQHRMIHLDLKGAPPRLDYIIKILKLSSRVGATGVLLEYEDMFPFSGQFASVAATNHYNISDVMAILDACAQLKLEVIPLVQTFGHMEFILKLPEFAYLRDAEDMPESICSCHDHTMPLIEKYINQVMALHPNARYLHIGCDEVFHMGECESCVLKGLTRSDLFVQHVERVANYVKERFKITVIIWDDMLRNLMAAEMLPLAKLVEPMVWVYAPDVYQFMPTYNWDKLSQVFDTAWTASAFKGAHGPTLTVPPIEKHLANTLTWLNVMRNEAPKFNQGFRGIVLTGWQRYDHFAVLCEILPAAIPSLVVNLVAATNGFLNSTLKNTVYEGLECASKNTNLASSVQFQTFIDVQNDPYLWDKMSWCFFPGVQAFKLTRSLDSIEYQVKQYLKKVRSDQGWLTDFSVRHNFSSPFRVEEGLEEFTQHLYSVTSLMRQANQALSEMFDHYTVAEWVEQKIYPMYKELSLLKNNTDALKQRRSWPKRPFEPLESLREFGIGAKQPEPTGTIINQQQKLRNQKLPAADSYAGVRLQTARPKRLVQQPDYYRHPQKVVVNSE